MWNHDGIKMNKDQVAIALGDGIGPEIMQAVLRVLEASGAPLSYQTVAIGPQGIDEKTWEILRLSKSFLKSPITTPQGSGFKSLNVTIRTTLGLFANVRPCIAYAPFIPTKHPQMDVIIVRENEEDLYAGIEYRQTPNVATSLKIISRAGSEKIVRFAFEYALANGRKKVSCFTKDNIMKMTDGLFHAVFDEIAKEYPSIEHEHGIVDIGAAKLAAHPEQFDVIVLPNLYGDILSDVAAEISGSVGIAGSANIGTHGAMFEAIHGSAPKRAGQNVANPSGLLLAAVQMLLYLGHIQEATLIQNAWLKTIEDGLHTYDIFNEKSRQKVGTKEFADSVIARLGKRPETLKPAAFHKLVFKGKKMEAKTVSRELVGADIFVYHTGSLEELVCQLKGVEAIFNRGVKVWPTKHPETFCIEEWRCRFRTTNIVGLLQTLQERGLDVIKMETLFLMDGKESFS